MNLKRAGTILLDYFLIGERLRHIEDDVHNIKEHILVVNSEMGVLGAEQERQGAEQVRQSTRQDKISEDTAYIRGRLDG